MSKGDSRRTTGILCEKGNSLHLSVSKIVEYI